MIITSAINIFCIFLRHYAICCRAMSLRCICSMRLNLNFGSRLILVRELFNDATHNLRIIVKDNSVKSVEKCLKMIIAISVCSRRWFVSSKQADVGSDFAFHRLGSVHCQNRRWLYSAPVFDISLRLINSSTAKSRTSRWYRVAVNRDFYHHHQSFLIVQLILRGDFARPAALCRQPPITITTAKHCSWNHGAVVNDTVTPQRVSVPWRLNESFTVFCGFPFWEFAWLCEKLRESRADSNRATTRFFLIHSLSCVNV